MVKARIIMEMIDQGMNGRVYETSQGVKKEKKRGAVGHDILTQKRIHHLAERILKDLGLKILNVPHLHLESQFNYEMDRIDTEKIVYLGDPNHGHPISDELRETLCSELAHFWLELYKHGFAAWDFELFVQPDGTIMLLDFDKFGFRMTSGPVSILMPTSRPENRDILLEYFFQNPCFPHDFVDRLRALGFQPPADCLPTRKN